MRRIDEAPFVPHKIIKVYKQGYHREFYLEQCNVTIDKDGEVIVGPGKPLSKNAVRRIAGTASREKFDSVLKDPIMDPGILSFNPFFHKRFIMWYRPQKKRTFHVRKDEYKLYMPAMLFIVAFDKLYLFSMKSNARPQLSTQLFTAPLFNLSNTFNFCWGSVKLSKDIKNVDEEVRFWEHKIWDSEFAHMGTRCTKNEITKIYKSLNNTNTRFPKSELVNVKMTIEQAIKKFKP